MYKRKALAWAVAVLIALSSLGVASAKASVSKDNEQKSLQGIEPLNLAVLIQDDLISQVGNEIGVTKDFIRSLPEGSRVMVGYITTGTLQVRQPFTTDLDKAAKSLRIPLASRGSSAFNPYVEVLEALKKFDNTWTNANAVLLISDGLDTSRGFDSSAAGQHRGSHPTLRITHKPTVS